MRTRTRSNLRAAVVTLVAGFLIPIGARAQATEPEPLEPSGVNPAAVAFDVLVVRPFAFLALPIGVAAFIPAALLTSPGGMDSIRAALDLFVTDPAVYVFRRPLGEF